MHSLIFELGPSAAMSELDKEEGCGELRALMPRLSIPLAASDPRRWSRWVYLTRQRVQMEQRMLERSERDAARRARRAKLEALVEPELHQAELGGDQGGKIAGPWRGEDEGKLVSRFVYI